MAGDFYKHLFLVGLCIFLTTMDSGVQTTLMIQNTTSSLNGINFTVITNDTAGFNITVADAYTNEEIADAITDISENTSSSDNDTEYFVKISKLPSGSLFAVTVNNTEVEEKNISTIPEAVKVLKANNVRITTTRLSWAKYEPPQKRETPVYLIYENEKKLVYEGVTENFKNLSQLKPKTVYIFHVSVSLYNHTSENVSTSFTTLAEPTAVENLKTEKVQFTSAKILWDRFVQPEKEEEPKYRISYGIKTKTKKQENITENYKELSQLQPNTNYIFVVSVLFYDSESKKKEISFTTLTVLPPQISVVAVNSSALNVTWIISEDIYPQFVDIISKSSKTRCSYKNKFCVIKVSGQPGTKHALSVFSVQETFSSEKKNISHPTKPLPPVCSTSTNSSSVNVTCSQPNSVFDFYLINFINKGLENRKKIPRDGVNTVTTQFPNLLPNTEYSVLVRTSSDMENSTEEKIMFFTNPSLDEVNITPNGHSIIVNWTKPNFESCSLCLNYNYNFSCKTGKKSVKFENLKAGMEYWVNVTCNSKWSETRSVVIPPLPPTGIKLSPSTNSINISWEWDDTKSEVENWFISIDGKTFQIPGYDRSYEVENLTSGTDYNVSIWNSAANKNSSKENRRTTTLPECMTSLSNMSVTETSITLYLSATNNSFEYYEFHLQAQNGSTHIKQVTKNRTSVTFSFLEAGSEYNISVITKIGDDQSKPCDSTITARTKPNSPIVKCIPSVQSIHVQLTKGEGYIDGFEVSCPFCVNFTTTNISTHSNSSLDIQHLSPNEMYNITVRSFADDMWSETSICNSKTNETAPSAVMHLNYEESEKNMVNLTWERPKNENGIIRWYIVNKTGQQVGTSKEDIETLNTTEENYLLRVKSGYSYSISVSAFTVAQGPPSKKIHFTTRTYPPAFKSNMTEDMKRPNKSNEIGQKSITVEFPKNPFAEDSDNGRILNYTVIVSTSNETEKPQPSVLPNWHQAKSNSSIKTYQVINNCTNLYEKDNECDTKSVAGRQKRSAEMSSIKFKIGVEDCSKEKTSYCNGFLEPGTDYYVKVRAYTQDAFQDTPFSVAIRTESENTVPGYVIALPIVFLLVTVFVIGLVYYLWKRRRLPKTTKAEKETGPSISLYKIANHPVSLADFKDHVIRMSSDSDFQFAEEYEDLKDVGKNQEMVSAQLMCNRSKNRFANILPYDHSRVKLSSVDDEEGSDYINANYLPGFNSPREYIVTQGPLCSTRDDFWRMVSEQNVHNIVMLTRCVEKLQEKCYRYWPESGDPVYYGDVWVAKMHETITPDWTITELRIHSGEKSWKLRHFHFTSWPDFGVPNSPQVLVHFVQTVRRKLVETGQIVVHCSAGVGRSGTFIAVDHCMQRIKTHNNIDILGMVHEMRMHRVLMVQTEQQYIYIHNCLVNALEYSETEDIYQNVTINQNGGHDNKAFLEDDEGIHDA